MHSRMPSAAGIMLALILVTAGAPVLAADMLAPKRATDWQLRVHPLTGALLASPSGADIATPAPGDSDERTGLPSNSVIDLEAGPSYLWLATGAGLGRFAPAMPPSGNPSAGDWFVSTHEDNDLGRGGVSAVTRGTTPTGGDVVWAATAFDTTAAGEELATGGGVGFSLDDGESWTWMPQPVDSLSDQELFGGTFKPTVTAIQNVTYDIGILGDRVWIASWGGGVRYFDMPVDMDAVDPLTAEWVNRPPDDVVFDVASRNNHRGFSVAVMEPAAPGQDSLLWVGTAGGVNLSRDNGASWSNFRFDSGNDQTPNGDFVPSMGAQVLADGRRILWIGGWVVSAEAGQYYGVSKTADEGATWQRVLGSPETPIRVHNFAFQDSIVYAATDDGLYKSADFGETWGRFPNPIDLSTREQFFGDEVFSAAHGFERLWVGGPEGLGISGSGGNQWDIAHTNQPVAGDETYAYPNPFSPQRFPIVRLHYTMQRPGPVTVEVYDFAMELLVRPVNGESRSTGEQNEYWDGLGPNGEEIANGVYFYRIEGGGEERWGKILLLD